MEIENLKMYKPSKVDNTLLEEYDGNVTVIIKEDCFSFSDSPYAFFKMNSTRRVKHKFNDRFVYLLRDGYKEIDPIYVKLNFFQYIKFRIIQLLYV